MRDNWGGAPSRLWLLALSVGVLSGCRTAKQTPEPAVQATTAEASSPVRASSEDPDAAAPQVFGAKPASNQPVVPVDTVLEEPEAYLGSSIRCGGTVARVCERAGCWLELQGEVEGRGLRVPMAGHAFFVPQSIVGQRVVIEGKLSAQELRPEDRAHLEGEGLKAVGPLSLIATSVMVF